MEISDIRVKLIQDSSDRLKAVCSITLDNEFVVRDLKVVEGTNGLFVAMPSRKLSVHCPQCRGKNHLRARFCNECGAKLPAPRMSGDAAGRMRMHRDIAHPINPTFRETVQTRVIERYREESELAKSPDYTPVDIDAEFEEQIAQVTEEAPSSAYAPSEYDQLIAGLNKGPGGEATRDRESRPVPTPPAARGPRRDDRDRDRDRGRGQRSEQRPARPVRGTPPRQGQRNDSRRGFEPARPRPQTEVPRPAPGLTEYLRDEELDEINGNVATPEPPPPQPRGRRPAPPPPRRNDDRGRPRRTDERPVRRDTNERPAERPAPRESIEREVERPAPRETIEREVERTAPPEAVERKVERPVIIHREPERRVPEPIAKRVEQPVAPPPPPAAPPMQPPATSKPRKLDDLPFGAGL